MSAASKNVTELARKLYKLSFDNNALSSDRVAGVLEYVEKHAPANSLAVLKAYRRLVVAEVARNHAVIEHAGTASETTLSAVAKALAQKYGRPVETISKDNPALIAGLRVRIGDDIYESSVAGQLADLAANV
jgi:F-type H+-transporting ATPase subunit delta